MLKSEETFSVKASGLTQRELIIHATWACAFVTCQRWDPCVVSRGYGNM